MSERHEWYENKPKNGGGFICMDCSTVVPSLGVEHEVELCEGKVQDLRNRLAAALACLKAKDEVLESMKPIYGGPPYCSDLIRFFEIRDQALALRPETIEAKP